MITRFAPSPTGPLHLGHAFSAITAHDMARAAGGRFLLRMEDTDLERSKPQWEAQIIDDLTWLGLTWDGPILRQSEHLARYNLALARLADMGLLYPCACTRAEIRAAQSAPQEGVTFDVYPGTCRHRAYIDRQPGDALRLHMDKALDLLQIRAVGFTETGETHRGDHALDPAFARTHIGDVVLGRRDLDTAAYFLASALDDIEQSITCVIRGVDLFDFTILQVLLLTLLGHPVPTYHHHGLIRDETGKRLAKRDDARAIRTYRDAGATPTDIRRMVGL